MFAKVQHSKALKFKGITLKSPSKKNHLKTHDFCIAFLVFLKICFFNNFFKKTTFLNIYPEIKLVYIKF